MVAAVTREQRRLLRQAVREPPVIVGERRDCPILLSSLAFHASAPAGMKCADCIAACIPCPDCYFSFWMIINPDRPLASTCEADNFVRPG